MKVCLACDAAFAGASWTCPQCGSTPAADPFPTFPMLEGAGFREEFFDVLADVEPASFWFGARNRLITWAVRRHAPAATSFLDVGCGTGFVLAGLREAFPGQRLTGLEPFPEGLAVARSRVPDAELLRGDARQLPFREEFDCVGAFDVLEHVADDERVLGELLRALRPGGLCLVTVPQHPWLWSATDDAVHHLRRYTRRELLGKARAAGFDIAFATSFVSLLVPALYASRLRTRRQAHLDLRSEFPSGRLLNAVLGGVMTAEHALVRSGVRLPVGGSLLLAARRPARP